MQIDWLTVAAQIVNFLVLVWLLQRFLYGPITRAMARRENRIEERLSGARQKREEAEKEAERLEQKRADLDARTDEIIEKVRQEADDVRQKHKQEIEQETEAERAALKKRLKAETDDALEEIRKRASASTFGAVRAILRDFADADLGAELVARFISHLHDLPEDDLTRLTKAARDSDEPARVESGTDLPSAAKAKLTRAIHEAIEKDLGVEYTTEQDLLLGLRLSIGGQTAEWSAARHLDRLENDIRAALAEAGPRSVRKDAA